LAIVTIADQSKEATMTMNQNEAEVQLEIISNIVSAYVGNNAVPTTELPALIESVATAIARLSPTGAPLEIEQTQKPAVPIKKSVTPDYIVSLEDGLKFKSLKRALSARYGLTPDQYRQKWNLPSDYPMVAPNYSKARSELALQLGLGRKTGAKPGRRRKS
jgi:predicted transcriptional regulator